MRPVEDQRNYLTATFDTETEEPKCFAVFLLREELDEALAVNSWLGGHVYRWITGRSHAACIEVMWENEGAQVELEEILKRIGSNVERVKWCEGMVPEMPVDRTETNCYGTLPEALKAWGVDGVVTD